MDKPVPTQLQQTVPSTIMGVSYSSNSRVSIFSFQSARKDIAPQVPKRKSSRKDLLFGRSRRRHAERDESAANARFDDCCGGQSIVFITMMTSLTDGSSCDTEKNSILLPLPDIWTTGLLNRIRHRESLNESHCCFLLTKKETNDEILIPHYIERHRSKCSGRWKFHSYRFVL